MEEMWKNSAIIAKRNVDDNQNPISVQLSELKQIIDVHSCIVLNQLPDEFQSIDVEGYTEVDSLDKVSGKTFKVDYANGVLYFHPNNVGKMLTIDYYGTGYTLLSASRIITKYDKFGNVLETLEELIDKAKLYIKAIESLGGAVEVINKLDADIESGGVLHETLTDDIQVGTQVKDELVEKTTIANTTMNALIDKTNKGNETVNRLDSSIVNAVNKKQELDNSITEAIETNTILSNTREDAVQTDLTLKQTIASGQDSIDKINKTGNKSLIIGASQFINNEYTWTHNMNSKELNISMFDADTDVPLMLDCKPIGLDKILVRNSSEHPNIRVVLSASYYNGNSAIGTTIEDFAGDSIDVGLKKVRLKDENGIVKTPVTDSDAVFMSDGKTKLTEEISNLHLEILETINSLKNTLTLNIKWFGAKGDGLTDDTGAFELAFAYIKNLMVNSQTDRAVTLFVPDGTYVITHGFDIDFSVYIKGEGQAKNPSYRLFGKSAFQQEMRPNVSTIKYDTPKSNMTMFRIVEPNTDVNKKYGVDFYIENIMLDGSDGITNSIINPTGKGVKDLTIDFDGVKSNGIDLTGVKFLRGSSNVFVTGFSGFGIKTHLWQQHIFPMATICGTGIITGGDGGITTPYIAFCKNGIQIGTSSMVSSTDRIVDCRIEWCEEHGINVVNGGNNRISGYIDRCGYSGYIQDVDTWGMNIDLTIQRCGCVWRGATVSDIDSNLKRKQCSNAYIFNSRGGNYRFTQLRSGSRDEEESNNYKSPVIASSLIGCEDIVSIESSVGFNKSLLSDYYLDNNTNYTIVVNGQMHSSNGIKIDKESNKTYVDLFDQLRFRPPTNWGKPLNTTGANGDIIFDSQNNIFYGKKNDIWTEL